jgi:predicted polyphosphate/ATP-dependent NAD kinase
MTQIRLGLIVNPVAGIGGRVGLKGSDGAEIQKKALEMGAVPQAQSRAVEALERLKAVEGLEIVTYPGEMGEDAARACAFEPEVIGAITPGQTTAQNTRDAASAMQRRGVDLLLFAGGDGTARDIYTVVGTGLPVLGIPAGVKIHSAVYATHPRSAGQLAALYLQGKVTGLREVEVMDIDEEAFRQNVLSVRLYGYLKIPFRSNLVPGQKMPSTGEADALAAIAEDMVTKMEEDVLYIIGPGTTTRAIAQEMGLEKTLLGVDVVLNRELVARDAGEAQLLALLDGHGAGKARIVVTPIGGQGYLFGRGNQQISPRVIERVGRQGIVAVSTPDKLYALGSRPLLVDTGSRTVDEMLSGYLTLVTGYNERAVRKVACDVE